MKTNLKTQTNAKKTVLRFSPTAWAKLLYLRDAGDTEVGGFAITRAGDLLFVEDVRLVPQSCTWAHVEFDDQSVADYFDEQVDAGLHPEQFARIWIHTHPGNSAEPSGTDEATFKRVFGSAHWALMFILARGGQTFARMRFNTGPGGEVSMPVEVDYGHTFAGSDQQAWHEEYFACVQIPEPEFEKAFAAPSRAPEIDFDGDYIDGGWREAWSVYVDSDQPTVEEPYGYMRDF